MNLMVLVMHDISQLREVIEKWRDADAGSITVLDSASSHGFLERAGRYELPIFPSLRDLFGTQEAPGKTLFCVVTDELVDPLIEVSQRILGDLSQPGKGLLFVVPVTRVVGQHTE